MMVLHSISASKCAHHRKPIGIRSVAQVVKKRAGVLGKIETLKNHKKLKDRSENVKNQSNGSWICLDLCPMAYLHNFSLDCPFKSYNVKLGGCEFKTF
jgi:hypothetical protein